MRLKRLSQQLTDCKHRLFEVSRDRQVIATYVRRHEQSWSCRHDRLRMEVLRLQKLIHELQKSPDQPGHFKSSLFFLKLLIVFIVKIQTDTPQYDYKSKYERIITDQYRGRI